MGDWKKIDSLEGEIKTSVCGNLQASRLCGWVSCKLARVVVNMGHGP